VTIPRASRHPQPRPAAEVLAETNATYCDHGGAAGRCPMCRAAEPEPEPEPGTPRPPRQRRPKPEPSPPVQLPLPGVDDDPGPATRRDR